MIPLAPPHDILAQRAQTTPTKPALIDTASTTTLTYAELSNTVDTYCAGLLDQGIQSNDHLGTLLNSPLEFTYLYYATNRLGAIFVPLNTMNNTNRLVDQTTHADIDLVICDETTETTANKLPQPACSIDPPTTPSTDHLTPLSPSELPNPHPSNVRLILFTSGTTSAPKAVPLTNTNLFSSAIASAFRLGITTRDRWLCCLPLYHMGGLAPIYRSTLYGTTTVLHHPFDPTTTTRAMYSHSITGVSLVPTMLNRLLETDWTPTETLRFILLGGAPASEQLIHQCNRDNVPVYPTYGMTETASQIATADPETAFSNPQTVGTPLLFTHVSIIKDNEPVPPGTTGEITVTGPTVISEYYHNTAATDSAFGPHGFRTGDTGYRDTDGLLYVQHRRADRITTGGETVDPTIIVNAIATHPAVTDAAVIGLDHPDWGQQIGALIETKTPLSEQDILNHLEPHLASYELPKTIRFTDNLPRTPSGTIDRDAVKDKLTS